MSQPAQSAADVLKAYYIKLGIMPDKKDLTETEKAFGPLLKKLNEFATQDLKGTVWTKSGTLRLTMSSALTMSLHGDLATLNTALTMAVNMRC